MDNTSLFFVIFGLNGISSSLDKLMIFGAEYLIYLTVILMFILTFKGGTKERKALLLAILTIPISILLIKVIHIFINEPRPFVNYHLSPLTDSAANASFPSRHTSIMSGIAFAYVYFKSKWTLLFLLLMLWVGVARIFVGVHFPVDIIGGSITGLISSAVALQIIYFLRKTVI